jgi:phospholipid/cholesterol/gamma-HCH transport system ATP-binding protein
MQLIRRINDSLGLTSIIVSHDVQEVSAISDYIYMLSNGKVIGQGAPAELGRSTSPWVRQFLDAQPDGPVPFHYPAVELAQDLFDA